MLVKDDLINKIKDYFGLNVYETKVWLALLSKGIASAGEISTISGVPRSRTYDVLESLEKKGFAIEKLGKPVKYIGVKPGIILEKIKNNVNYIFYKENIEHYGALEKIIKKYNPEIVNGDLLGGALDETIINKVKDRATASMTGIDIGSIGRGNPFLP